MARPKLTVPAAFRRYARALALGESDPRAIGRLRVAEATLRRCYPRLLASRFGGRQLKRVREHLLGGDRKSRWTGEPLSRTYVNHLVGVVGGCWTWLLSEGLVSAQREAEVRAVKPLRYGQGGREPAKVGPPRDGWDRILHHLTPTIRAMVLTHVCGGMRSQDVCSMRRGDISVSPSERVEFPGKNRHVTAYSAGGVPVWVYVPRSHKTAHKGKPRAIPLGPRAQAILWPLVEGLKPDDHVFCLDHHLREAGRITSVGRVRRKIAQGVYAAYIARMIERVNAPLVKAGTPAEYLIPHWFPHQLRHLQATVVGDALDRAHARALLGHAGGSDMIDLYVEQELGKAGKAAARCG